MNRWKKGDLQGETADSVPGRIEKVEKEAFYVRTGNGLLKILQVQLEGKKRMPVKDFLLGYPLEAGTVLGLKH